MFKGKREFLARALDWSGAALLVRRLPERELLLILNYHRIGDPDGDLFGPGVFSATGDQFNEQISYLKRHFRLVTLDEAIAFVDGTIRDTARRCRVLITFDDGYLDNYSLAFPILRSHGVQGVFFLPTGTVGSCCVPWWDHIGYVLKAARQRRFSIGGTGGLLVDIDANGFTKSWQDMVDLCARPGNSDPAQFIQDLTEAAKGDEPPRTLRRFLNWDEAREMIGAGMAIGSHTHSHRVLSQLGADGQRDELAQSRALLEEQLGIEAQALAYPVGSATSFSRQTQQLAQEVGYRIAFSFHGGTNRPGNTRRYDVKRIAVGHQSRPRFRVQAAVCRFTGKYWP